MRPESRTANFVQHAGRNVAVIDPHNPRQGCDLRYLLREITFLEVAVERRGRYLFLLDSESDFLLLCADFACAPFFFGE